MDAYHIEFKRLYTGDRNKIHAELLIETKKTTEARKVKFDFGFNCIPYVIADLRKVWLEERKARISEVNRVDESLNVIAE